MTTQDQPGWPLPPKYLGLIVVPILVFGLTNLLLSQWGDASLHLAQPYLRDGHAEAAGRLRTLATFLLFSAVAVAALVAFALAFRSLDPASRRQLGAAYSVSVAIGLGLTLWMQILKGDSYLEQTFACASLHHIAVPAGTPERPDGVAPPARAEASTPRAAPERINAGQLACSSTGWAWETVALPRGDLKTDRFLQLRLMFLLAALLLMLALPAVVWGAIACLALPTAREQRLEACRVQSDQLTRLLYVTAALMVAGLLFTGARMSWPGYSLHPDDVRPFNDHVSALILWAGVANSVLIASYYVPVAAALATEGRCDSAAELDVDTGAAQRAGGPDPFAAFKTAATILAPALLGLVGQLVELTG